MAGNYEYLDPIAGEVWKTIKGYEDYEVSSHGRVRSYKKLIRAHGRAKVEALMAAKERGDKAAQWFHPLILKPTPSGGHGDGKDGGYHVTLHEGDDVLTTQVARWVYEAFVGEIPDGCDVWHLSHDNLDDRPHNLVAVTRTQADDLKKNRDRFPPHELGLVYGVEYHERHYLWVLDGERTAA